MKLSQRLIGPFLTASVVVACAADHGSSPEQTARTSSALTTGMIGYLHRGGTLDAAAPGATTAATNDSAAVRLAGGNPWVDVGTWSAAPSFTNGTLTTLGDLRLWVGLKNSDDIGTNFDLRAEVYRNGALAAATEKLCVQGVTRNPSLATAVALSFGSFASVSFDGASDVLSLKVRTRIGTDGAGASCGGHASAVGLRTYFDAETRAASMGLLLGTGAVAERWVLTSCRLDAGGMAPISSYVDSGGDWYFFSNSTGFTYDAGTIVNGPPFGPYSKRTLSGEELIALHIATRTLASSTAGWMTTTGPAYHMNARSGLFYSSGAPHTSTFVDRWIDGIRTGESITTHNEPAAAIVRKYRCFTPHT